MFAALFCCALSSFAEETPIRLKKEELPNERSLVLLYTGVYRAQEVAITLPSLPAGGYTLTIHVENCIYSGEFEIE